MRNVLVVFVALLALANAQVCSNFDADNACATGATSNPPSFALRRWQTPPKGDPQHKPAYQDYSSLVAYASLSYSADRLSATIDIRALKKSDAVTLTYVFGTAAPQSSPSFRVTSASAKGPMVVQVRGSDGTSITLDEIDFVWNAVPVPAAPGLDGIADVFEGGQKGVILELFGWPYADIEMECPFLAKMGYMGIKIYPPQESVLSMDQPIYSELNPWWWMYQPVSYRLQSRWGTRAQLRSLIATCRRNGVRVFADAVVNHMAGSGNSNFNSSRTPDGANCAVWGPKSSTGGSPYWSQGFQYQQVPYTGERPASEFPAVPYGPLDFHCQQSIVDWGSGNELGFRWLGDLADLDTESDYVRERIAAFMTDLLSIGFSGFRIDAAKHIPPASLAVILGKVRRNMGGGELPADFVTWLEVLFGGEGGMLMCNYNSYNFGSFLNAELSRAGYTENDINKVKIWSSDYPAYHPICNRWMLPSQRWVIQQDCHDDQVHTTRQFDNKGSVLVLEKNVEKHRRFNIEMFTRKDGDWKIRMIMSSYSFMDSNGAKGPPDGFSDCRNCTGTNCAGCISMPYRRAHNPDVCGYTCVDNTTGRWVEGEYTRVHRDVATILAMRKWLSLPTQDVIAEEIGLPARCGPFSDKPRTTTTTVMRFNGTKETSSAPAQCVLRLLLSVVALLWMSSGRAVSI